MTGDRDADHDDHHRGDDHDDDHSGNDMGGGGMHHR
jgi:hypothetical protein